MDRVGPLLYTNSNRPKEYAVKTKEELKDLMEQIRSANSPVGIDAVYVHALILDRLISLENRLQQIETVLETD